MPIHEDKNMTSITMTVRLDDQLKVRLDKLAEVTHRSKSFLAAEAINEYLEIQEWQLSEIKTGISEANAEQLVDHNTIANYWEQKRADSMDEGR
jgi:RHH-type rel operon transcriptional repressor/antitoxin RelB